jgi:hypothetical protein
VGWLGRQVVDVVVGVVAVVPVAGTAGTGWNETILEAPASRVLLVLGYGGISELGWCYEGLVSAWALFLLLTSERGGCQAGRT